MGELGVDAMSEEGSRWERQRGLLGAGPWRFRAALTRGSTTCTAELDVVIEAGATTRACAVMTCP